MEEYSKSNETLGNNTDVIYIIGVRSQIGNAVISILTIVLNCIILICMRTHRSKISEVVRHQLMSLSTSDLISGISTGIWCLCLFPRINQDARLCTAMHMIFSTCQYATLLNLCHLSARRWIVIRNYSRPYLNQTRCIPLVFIFTSLSWTISLAVHLPTLLSFTKNLKVNGCVSPELFENPSGVIYLVPLYGTTLLALDVFFLCSLSTIKRSKQLVLPRSENLFHEEDTSGRFTRQVTLVSDTRRQTRITTEESNATELARRMNLSLFVRTRAQLMQQMAFKHLVVAFIVSNIATLPYLGIMISFVLGLLTFNPSDVFVIDMQILAMNSLLNPLIYGLYLREVRTALKENVLKLKYLLLNPFRQNQSSQTSQVPEINIVSNTFV